MNAPEFLPEDSFTEDELTEAAIYGSLQRADGSVFFVWRRDFHGAQWFRAVPTDAARADRGGDLVDLDRPPEIHAPRDVSRDMRYPAKGLVELEGEDAE